MTNLPWKPATDDEYEVVIRSVARPKEGADSPEKAGRFRRFLRELGHFYGRYIRGWSWQQIDRFREAKLREIESSNEEREAGAALKRAEARKLVAEAESIFLREERIIEAEVVLVSGDDCTSDGDAAEERLRHAIELIELKGGNVSFPMLPDPTSRTGSAEPPA